MIKIFFFVLLLAFKPLFAEESKLGKVQYETKKIGEIKLSSLERQNCFEEKVVNTKKNRYLLVEKTYCFDFALNLTELNFNYPSQMVAGSYQNDYMIISRQGKKKKISLAPDDKFFIVELIPFWIQKNLNSIKKKEFNFQLFTPLTGEFLDAYLIAEKIGNNEYKVNLNAESYVVRLLIGDIYWTVKEIKNEVQVQYYFGPLFDSYLFDPIAVNLPEEGYVFW